MSVSQKIFIVILGIILSFLLYPQSEKYNFESTEYGQIVQSCEEKGIYCEYLGLNKEQEMIEKYGAPYWKLAVDLKRQKIFVIIPCLILIVTIFVSFTIDGNERLFAVLVVSPLLITFILKYFLGAEFCMTPIYLLLVVVAATFFARVKRWLYLKNP